MDRRAFLHACALASGTWPVEAWTEAARAPVHGYARVLLTDTRGDPLRAGSLAVRRNYLFHYPYVATPCFLLNLGKPLAPVSDLHREDGTPYDVGGGVGPLNSIVAYSAICAHKLAYPAREVSFIRFQSESSPKSEGDRIHCCAEHSVYDPAQGARVVGGPAPQPLAAIVLEYEPAQDRLYAVGTAGGELFDAFFAKYDFKLGMEYGPGKGRTQTRAAAVVQEMTEFCRQTIQC